MMETLAQLKARAFEIALTLPDDDSVDIVRVKPRRFEIAINSGGKRQCVRPIWTRSGAMARIEERIAAAAQTEQDALAQAGEAKGKRRG